MGCCSADIGGEKSVAPDPQACRSCTVGSCCYEGVDVSIGEMRRIIAANPDVPKPWFKLVGPDEEPEPGRPYATVTRNGTCVFQDAQNRCRVYKVRPWHCRDFPFEAGKKAPYFERLCVLCKDRWTDRNIKRTYHRREVLKER